MWLPDILAPRINAGIRNTRPIPLCAGQKTVFSEHIPNLNLMNLILPKAPHAEDCQTKANLALILLEVIASI